MAGKFWDKGPMLVTGCTRVSPGCKNCWSERAHVMRSKNPAVQHIYSPDLLTNGRFNGKVQFNPKQLKEAVKGKPCVISPWNDLYHPGVTDDQIFKAYGEILLNPHHTYIIITKRPERAVKFWDMVKSETKGAFSLPRTLHHIGCLYDNEGNETYGNKFFKSANKYAGKYVLPLPDNIWHITTTENQEQADKRIPHLLRIPGKRGIIIEPALGAVDLNNIWAKMPSGGKVLYNLLSNSQTPGGGIHQVIMGAETGHGARPMYLAWARSVRDQCAAAGVPFYLKSLGDGRGRTLDGVEHNELAWKEGVK